jgi:predicted PurR-regulated permease PerM
MTPVFKKFLLIFTIYLLIFLVILWSSIFTIGFFSNKINNELEERNNIIKMLASQQSVSQQNFLISSKISELEKKHNINFNEFKTKLLTSEVENKETIKNLLNEIANENNLKIKNITSEEITNTISVELEGDINDLVKFEKGIKSRKLKIFIDEVRMIKQDKNYLIKILISTF